MCSPPMKTISTIVHSLVVCRFCAGLMPPGFSSVHFSISIAIIPLHLMLRNSFWRDFKGVTSDIFWRHNIYSKLPDHLSLPVFLPLSLR